MKRTLLFSLITILLQLVINAQNANYYSNKIAVKVIPSGSKTKVNQKIIEQIELQLGVKISKLQPMFKGHQEISSTQKNTLTLSSIYEIELSDGKRLLETINLLNQLSEVEYAEPIYKIDVLEAPNDPQIESQYYLPLIKAFDAFDITQGDTNIVIGIVDTGVDFYHEDLQANFKFNYNDTINGIDDDMDGFIDNYRGWDFGENDNNAQSEYNHHGTIVAGLASAVTNNSIGIASIGYLTKLLPIKVMDETGDMSTAYQGIVYAADHGCQIINCSWGGTAKSLLGADVIDYAVNKKNCVVIAAAGNGKTDTPYYPASLKGVLSVAATDWSDLKWTGSTYGIEVDICAPGSNVRSTNQNNTYINGFGTSFAAPLAAGVAALVKAYRPELNALQIPEQLRITSDIIDTIADNQYFYHKMGYGRINAFRALSISSLPSIRIENIEFKTNHDNSLSNGDTLIVSFSAMNYLAQVTNCIIRLTSNSEYITTVENIINTGVLDTMEKIDYKESPLVFKISDQMPENQNIQFTFEMVAPNTDGINTTINYKDYQIVNCVLNKTYIDIEPNKIATTLTSNGKIGYQNRDEKIGKGFVYNFRENLLNVGGIILATSKDNMASSLFDKTEYQTTEIIDTLWGDNERLIGNTSYQSIEGVNLPISIKQKTIAYKTGIWESSIIHEYSITNNGFASLNNLRMSIFADWNIVDPLMNEATYNQELNLFYTYTHSNQTMYAGICLLTPGITLPYGFDLVIGGNGGIDIMVDYTNEEKWFTMNNSRPNAGNTGDSLDVATLLTAGPYTVAKNDSLTISWALIAANNLYELTNSAETLQEYYVLANKDKISLKKQWNVYPNPAKGFVFIESNEITAGIEVRLYNGMGLLCKKITTNEKTFKLLTQDLKPGLYFIQINSESGSSTEKLIISN